MAKNKIKSKQKNKKNKRSTNISQQITSNNLKPFVFAALFAALTAAVAPLKIDLGFTPVPITLQTLVVLLSGAMLGPIYGAIAMVLYVTVGVLGLPVFAGGSSGFGAILGPTGGYLLSYFIAAYVIGITLKIRKNPKFIDYVVAMLAGTFIIYVLGAGWGMIVTGLGIIAILTGWVLPFIIGDLVKLFIAAYIAKSIDIKKYLR
jgi:biotin transport system substrate-specific component